MSGGLYVAEEPGKPYIPEEEDDLTGPQAPDDDYQDWNPATSRVISGPLGSAKFPGTRQATWQEAEAYVKSKYKLQRFWTMPGRWFARIARTP